MGMVFRLLFSAMAMVDVEPRAEPKRGTAAPDIRVWRPAGFEALEFHHGTTVVHPYPRHWHEEYLICAITGGAGYLEYPGTSHFTPRGTLFVVEPGEVHANTACAEGCSFRSVYVPPSLVGAAARQAFAVGALPSFSTFPITDCATIRSFLQLYRAMDRARDCAGSRLQRDSLLLCFLAELIRQHARPPGVELAAGRECVAVRTAKEFLDEHYDDAVSLDDLARLTRLSPFHLHRTFSRETGIPPHAYQVQVRIARAKVLLQKNGSLSDVALKTGFADQSHFTRHFKRLVGVTPARFCDRKNVQDAAGLAD